MNSQFLLKPIPIKKILEIANCHFADVIPLVDKSNANSVNLSVPAGGSLAEFPMDSIGNWHFLCTHVTGTFTTVKDDGGGGTIDDGVNRVLFNLNFGGWNRDLARVLFPLDHFFTPGRVRNAASTNNTGANQCAPSANLLIPRPMPALLLKTQGVTANFKNTSDKPNIVTMSFHGWRVSMNEDALQKILDSIDNSSAKRALL